ncbi:hypothetical protein NL676_007057 [Syzygium grande]|nr:hypothetical protein NL676_007057 [Syzygium grande]
MAHSGKRGQRAFKKKKSKTLGFGGRHVGALDDGAFAIGRGGREANEGFRSSDPGLAPGVRRFLLGLGDGALFVCSRPSRMVIGGEALLN